MSKISNLSLSDVFFQAPNAPKFQKAFSAGRTPLGELTTFPRPLVGWGGAIPPAYASPRRQRSPRSTQPSIPLGRQIEYRPLARVKAGYAHLCGVDGNTV